MWRWVFENLPGRKKLPALEILQEEIHERLQKLSASLAPLTAELKRLDVQVESRSERARALEERARTYRRVGREEIAAQLERELAELRREIDSRQKELESARALYAAHLGKTEEIRSRLRDKTRLLAELRDQTAAKRLQIEIDFALKEASREVEVLFKEARSVEAELGARHDRAAAKARVARDFDDMD